MESEHSLEIDRILTKGNTTEKRTVFTKVVFLKVGEIDTLKEFFVADVFIQVRWREPDLDRQAQESKKAVAVITGTQNKSGTNWENYWDPKIVIQNVLSESRHTEWKTLKFHENGEAFVVQKHRLKATFSENLELALFPFDIQDLSIVISTELSEAEIEIKEDLEELSSVQIESFTKEQEWTLHECVHLTPKITTKAYANPKFKNPAVTAGCFAGRRAGFFVWNVMLTMTLISSLSLATFSVERSLPQNRLQLSFTLVLTGVAFKFVANQTIPKISYLTHLDRYILGSMIFLYIVCIWHAVVSLVDDKETGRNADRNAFIVFATCFTILQISFIISVLISGYQRYAYVKRIERAYQEKAKRKVTEDQGNKKSHKNSKIGSLLI